MTIYVVQQNDTIHSIAERFGIDVNRFIYENDLENQLQLVEGQPLIIAYPKQSHIVEPGDSLQSIADSYQVTVMQLLRNNSFIMDRGYLTPGETLVISYNTEGTMATNGFTFPFIKTETLKKTLPNLTYLSVFNYRVLEDLEIYTYSDDTEMIRLSNEYQVIPLLLLSILTLQGEPDVDTAYRILLSEENQMKVINGIINIMKSKGYRGLNIVFNLLNSDNISYFKVYVQKLSELLKKENLLFFMTINYGDNQITEDIDYSEFSMYVDNMIFMQLKWGKNEGPPMPVSNINIIDDYINKILTYVSPDKITLGMSVIGYDWELPYVPQKSSITALRLSSTLELAADTNSVILFDEDSQTPYFSYVQTDISLPIMHIVWFIDARSVNALLMSNRTYQIYNSGIWNIMTYNAQLWLLFNSQFDILKIT